MFYDASPFFVLFAFPSKIQNPKSKIVNLTSLLFTSMFDVRCWAFDVRCSSSPTHPLIRSHGNPAGTSEAGGWESDGSDAFRTD